MNNWHLNTIKYSLGFGTLMTFYGMVGFITYMLPQEYVTRTTKIIIIVAMVLLTMPFAMLGAYLSNRKNKKKKLAEEKEAAEKAGGETAEKAAAKTVPASPAATANAPQDVVSGAEETVQFLKSSNLGTNGKDALYSLPWYLVAGDARAGKSSLVIGSNLDFQTLPSQRQAEQKTVRPTPAVDWRVTNDALFIDSSGKYFSDASNSEEWISILETVKKHRSQRPLDGFLLVVNAERILNSDEREIEELAKTLRSRLDEAVTRFKAKFPVYLIFTNADAIEGFRDSFSTSKKEDKTLVWGSTIPLEKSENAQALFDGEYEILQNSVMKRRLLRLSAPFSPVRQLRIFNFPLHFGAARRKFSGFVNTLFRPNPFSENPFLRGFYFTASPIGKAVGNMPPSVGNTYFTERLFRDVVLRDKDLARTFIDQKARAPIFGWLMTILGALVIFALLTLSAISLVSNRQMLAESRTVGESAIAIRKADAGKNVLEKNEAAVRDEIRAMDDLRSYMETLDDYERNGAPWLYRFGMYSGNGVYKEGLLPIYFGIVEKRFKEPALQKLESDLRKFANDPAAGNPSSLTEEEKKNLQHHFDLLKVYLMMSGEYYQHADSALIESKLKKYWLSESKIPAEMRGMAELQLAFWSRQVDRQEDGVAFPRISLNPDLVKDVRTKLEVFPAILQYYGKIVSEVSKEVDDKVGSTTVESMIRDSGGDPGLLVGTVSVPGAYTKVGYPLMVEKIENAATEIQKDNWVMGTSGKTDLGQTPDDGRLMEIYLRDYSEHWRTFIRGTSVKSYEGKKENATAALQKFAGPTSPVSLLLKEVARNTNLSDNSGAGLWAWIKSWFGSKATSETAGNTQVEKDFRPLFAFVDTSESSKAPIQDYQTTLGRVHEALARTSDAQLREIASKLGNEPNIEPLKLADRTTAISNQTQTFNESAAGQEIASFLQQPLDRLKEMLGADAKTQMQKAWKEQVLPAAKAIETGYPFESSAAEADLTKVTEFLNPETGTLSVFFKERLEKYFEESNGRLQVMETSEVQFTDEFVDYLNNAFALRKALYGTSSTPKFDYEFTIVSTGGGIIEVSIDGTKTTSEGTRSIRGTFPGSGTETGVLVSTANLAAAPVPTGDANTATSTNGSTGDSSQLRFTGNWGLFRFVDAGSPQKQAGGEYLLTHKVGGKTITTTIKVTGDLFDKTIFQKVRAPETFLK